MTETMLAPMANRGGTPRNIVRKGTMIDPSSEAQERPEDPGHKRRGQHEKEELQWVQVATPRRQRRAPTSPRLESCELRGAMLPGSLSITRCRASP